MRGVKEILELTVNAFTKMSEVTDLCTFWNNFRRLTSFGPKLPETALSQGNFRSDC